MSAGAELDPGEARRRSRISKANTGKVGWAPRTGHSVVEYNVSIGVCARRESKDIGVVRVEVGDTDVERGESWPGSAAPPSHVFALLCVANVADRAVFTCLMDSGLSHF